MKHQHDWKREQPERFARTVRATCGTMCIYPKCECGSKPYDVELAINAWETLIDDDPPQPL